MAKTATKKSKQKVCKAAESVAQVVQNTQLQVAYHFPCPIYIIERPDFLETVNTVSEEALEVAKKAQTLNEIYPVYMTGSYFGDPRMAGFSEFVGATAWNILNEQGYAMQDKAVSFTEMWTQEHHKHSAMDAHVHGYGSQIVGFYFLETPEGGPFPVYYDPRIQKQMIELDFVQGPELTNASSSIHFNNLKPGTVLMANSWMQHQLTQNISQAETKSVHFTVSHRERTCNTC
jgi:hypothetical protein